MRGAIARWAMAGANQAAGVTAARLELGLRESVHAGLAEKVLADRAQPRVVVVVVVAAAAAAIAAIAVLAAAIAVLAAAAIAVLATAAVAHLLGALGRERDGAHRAARRAPAHHPAA